METIDDYAPLVAALKGARHVGVLTGAGPPAVYRRTETQLHDFLAELERLDIAATVTEPSDGKASGGGLLYVSPAD